MKNTAIVVLLIVIAAPFSTQAQSIIVDHTCRDLSRVPAGFLQQARSQYRLAYGHTSHGSQIVSGMELLMQEDPSRYGFNTSGSGGNLFLRDVTPSGDLGGDGDTSWADRTREYLLGAGSDRNVIMWSWCGGCSSNTVEGIDAYLAAMTHLERDFPGVKFVYMTGHLDGTGSAGNLHQRNEQIRAYCRNNGKIVFDFADIESYDPDGKYFLDKFADDGCNYEKAGGQTGNWAQEWCAANPGRCPDCSCAHSEALNCYEKAKAFWWMMAMMAGWDGVTGTVIWCDFPPLTFELATYPNPNTGDATITLDLPVNSEVELTLWTALGTRAATILPRQFLWQGYYRYTLPNELAAGVYVLAVSVDGHFRTENIVVQRR